VGAELFHTDGWKDRRDEANNRFPQFCERAYKIVTFLITPVTDISIRDIFVHTEVCEVATAVTYLKSRACVNWMPARTFRPKCPGNLLLRNSSSSVLLDCACTLNFYWGAQYFWVLGVKLPYHPFGA